MSDCVSLLERADFTHFTKRHQMNTQTQTTLPICVILPVYNRAYLLERALASVWSQSATRPAEVRVVEDGSDDAPPEVARRLGARVVRHPENRGLAAARNTGL